VPHAFLNLTDEPGEIIVVHTPGGGHRFYQEFGPASRSGTMDRAALAAIFERHDMALLGPSAGWLDQPAVTAPLDRSAAKGGDLKDCKGADCPAAPHL
jgi:hypothetical protein